MSQQTALKHGDVVYLKSGGPAMTVNGKNNAGNFNCSWFLAGEIRNAYLLNEALTLEKPTNS